MLQQCPLFQVSHFHKTRNPDILPALKMRTKVTNLLLKCKYTVILKLIAVNAIADDRHV